MRLLLLFTIAATALTAAEHKLKASPETLAWGYYWAGAKPVLTVQSGDVVEIQTVSGNPENLERAGLPADQIQPELRKIYADVPKENRGPGGHLLTGPIAIAGRSRATFWRCGSAKSGWTYRMRTTVSDVLVFWRMYSRRVEPRLFRWTGNARSVIS